MQTFSVGLADFLSYTFYKQQQRNTLTIRHEFEVKEQVGYRWFCEWEEPLQAGPVAWAWRHSPGGGGGDRGGGHELAKLGHS